MLEKTKKQLKFEQYFAQFENMDSEKLMQMVEGHLNDEEIETFVTHIESFYGVTDDDELGTLAQIMITGYLCAKFEMK